jgi:hypothetical protein
MKKTITAILVAYSLSTLAQGAAAEKKMSVGLGITVGSGLGGNAHFAYVINKKFSLKLRGIITASPQSYGESPVGGYTKYSNLSPEVTTDISLTCNYFILGNNWGSKAGLYAGLGFGYYSKNYSYTTFSDPYLSSAGSATTKRKIIGPSTVINIGGVLKVGPGHIFLEGGFSYIVGGTDVYTNIYQPLYPYQEFPKISNSARGYNNIYVNLGYAFYFKERKKKINDPDDINRPTLKYNNN